MTAALPPIADDAPPLTALRTLPVLHERFTREGKCLFRKLPMSTFGSEQRFWAHWKKDQRPWLERGYSLGKDDAGWHVQQWLTKERTLTSVGAERLSRLTGPQPVQEEITFTEAPPNLDPLPAELEAKLFAYQVEPARQLHRAVTCGMAEWGYPGAVDFSDLGLGKSFTSLAAALATGRRVAVVCPPAGHPGWESVFAHFGAEPAFLTSYEAVRGNFRQHITKERADGEFEWQNAADLIIIFDEIQSCRHDSLTQRCCRGAIRQTIPIIAVSATAAISPLELRFVGRIVGLHKGADDWSRFLAQHGCYRIGNTWKWNKDRSTLARVHAKLFPRRGCRVRRTDLGDLCPETVIEILSLDVPEAVEIDREWKEARELFDRLTAAGVDSRIVMGRQRAAYSAVWQKCDAALIGPVVEHARGQLDEGRSVAFFLNFTETRLRIGKMLGTTAGFYGRQSKKARKWFMEKFQQDQIHVLVSNIGAGGASVSLHDIAGKRPRTSYIFPSDHVIKVEQATGRVDRVGGQSVSRQFIPCVKGTLIERMVFNTRRKMMSLGVLNDGVATSRI